MYTSYLDELPTARDALADLTRTLLAERGRGSVWRISRVAKRSADELVTQLEELPREPLALGFEAGIFEDLADPARLVAFCARRVESAVLSFEPALAAANPLTREGFETRLLAAGASFRRIIDLPERGRAYAIEFRGTGR